MWDADAYKRAVDFAATVHAKQTMQGSQLPYLVHLIKVAAEVMHACAEDPSADGTLAVQCALLHDCVEDAGVTRDELIKRFGPRVADGVDALTKRSEVAKADRMADSLRRICAQPREIAMVKLGDRITNLEPAPPDWSAEKRAKYREEAKQILDALKGRCASLEARLEKKIAEYEHDSLSPEGRGP